MANCKDCGTELTTKNWWASSRLKHDYECKTCCKERMRHWRDANREEYQKRRHSYYLTHQGRGQPYDVEKRRNHVLITSERVKLIGDKRPYPANGTCELCSRKPHKLGYHHYDDNDLKKGLWLCAWCHGLAERVDEGLYPKYLDLKARVNG